MDDFLKINWMPSLEDIVDQKFVDAERFRKESLMYRVLRGDYSNPFANLHEEQEHLVTSELMAQVGLENSEQKQAKGLQKSPATSTKPEEVVAVPQRAAYVPGLVKGRAWYPRLSSLSHEQQAVCLRVFLKFYGSQRPKMTAADNEKLQIYSSLSQTIAQEQQEFMEFAKGRWDASKFQIKDEDFINEQWKKKMKRIEDLPRYYTENGNVPFVSPKEIGLTYHFCCLKMGTLANTMLPTLTRRTQLTSSNVETPKINQRFFSVERNGGLQENTIFKLPVSEDANCDKLAKEHGADLVISSGGLNCLAINMDPQHTNSWILPVVVKRINDKNVVFIDKPLPPTGLTVIQKNTWLFKYKLKLLVNHPHHMKAISLDKKSVLDEAIGLQKSEKDENETSDAGKEKTDVDENSTANEDPKDGFLRPPDEHNIFYRLFSVDPCDETHNELLKTRVEKSFKLLVRSRTDGSVALPKGESRMMLVAPKLEHQMDLGAEAVTMEEAAKQWMSLSFRPETSLARVRIDAMTSEIIQIETRTPTSVNNEIKRLYKLKTDTALTLIYNVAETMTSLMPGRYLLRHTVRSGAFANIYKEVDGPGKNALDLQTIYWDDGFTTIPNPPWPAIDKGVITPAMKVYERMPAMFIGPRQTNSRKKVLRGKKKKLSKAKVVRKSARKKLSE